MLSPWKTQTTMVRWQSHTKKDEWVRKMANSQIHLLITLLYLPRSLQLSLFSSLADQPELLIHAQTLSVSCTHTHKHNSLLCIVYLLIALPYRIAMDETKCRYYFFLANAFRVADNEKERERERTKWGINRLMSPHRACLMALALRSSVGRCKQKKKEKNPTWLVVYNLP